MKYVLDTNALSALLRADPSGLAWLRAQSPTDVGLPQPVVSEIEYGLARMPRSKKRKALEERWGIFSRELPRVAWTDEVSSAFGTLKATLERRGRRLEDFDVAIAAHALAYDAVLITADVKHMTRVPGVRLAMWPRSE